MRAVLFYVGLASNLYSYVKLDTNLKVGSFRVIVIIVYKSEFSTFYINIYYHTEHEKLDFYYMQL